MTAMEKSVEVGLDVTKQLITIAAAIIPVAVGLIGLRYPSSSGAVPENILVWLVTSLVLYLSSIAAGFLVHLGAVSALREKPDFDVMYEDGVKYPAMGQQALFFLATLALIISLCYALI